MEGLIPLNEVPRSELKAERGDRVMTMNNVTKLVIHGAIKEGNTWNIVVSYIWERGAWPNQVIREHKEEKIELKLASPGVRLMATFGEWMHWRDVYMEGPVH
jgi:hypothetical protein